MGPRYISEAVSISGYVLPKYLFVNKIYAYEKNIIKQTNKQKTKLNTQTKTNKNKNMRSQYLIISKTT